MWSLVHLISSCLPSSFAGELQLHLHHFVAESLKTFDKVTAKYQMCYLWKHDVFFSRLGASNSV